jgi:hypothetical protein
MRKLGLHTCDVKTSLPQKTWMRMCHQHFPDDKSGVTYGLVAMAAVGLPKWMMRVSHTASASVS